MPKSAQWITSKEGAELLSAGAGRPITPNYVRVLARLGHVRTKQVDKRTKLYHREDCEAYRVSPLRGQRVTERVRDRRTGKPVGRPRKNQDSDEEEHWSKKYLTDYPLADIISMEVEWQARFLPVHD